MTAQVEQSASAQAATAPLRVIRPNERDAGTAQTPGMLRQAAVSPEVSGAQRLWMGHVTVGPGEESGMHHHGASESGIYIISGQARFRMGPDLAEHADAGPGDFIYVPAWAVHSEANLSQTEPVVAIVCRSISDDGDAYVYNDSPEAQSPA